MRLIGALAAAAIALTITTAVPASPVAASPGRPTVYTGDAPDPSILRVGSQYYAYTTNTGGAFGGLINMPVLQSSDLATWQLVSDGLPNVGSWATPGYTWAPAVAPLGNGGYVAFYTARERRSGKQCIGRATAGAPTGPFYDQNPGPVLCQRRKGGSIDPYVFTDRGGARYLLWKNDGNCCGLAVGLWGQRLDAGLRPAGGIRRLLVYDRGWERPLIEAPAMVRSPDVGGPYRLFYSANWWESASYATGYATCSGPLGPCTKRTLNHGWYRSTPSAYGPGGAAFFTDTGGRNWMVLHGWPRPPGRVGYPQGRRSLFVEKVDLWTSTFRVNTAYPYAWHAGAPHPYVDVPTWADAAVSWATSTGAVLPANDAPDRRFRPSDPLTRGAARRAVAVATGGSPPAPASDDDQSTTNGLLVGWLYAAAGSPAVDGPEYDHDLTDVPPALERAVRWALHDPDGTGPRTPVTTGYPDHTFRPTVVINRANGVLWSYLAFGQP